MEAGKLDKGRCFPVLLLNMMKVTRGTRKVPGLQRGRSRGHAMVTSPFESSGQKREVSGLYL